MKKTIKYIVVLGICISDVLASGYRIPEQSANAIALSAANIAAVNGADSAYYNPANMSWIDPYHQVELSLSYIHLPSIKFKNSSDIIGTSDTKSKKENFLVPNLFFVTPQYIPNWRFGIAITAPGGLSKRWQNAYGYSGTKKFALKIIELNPTASYMINDKISFAFGVRSVYTDGNVQSDASGLGLQLSRDMEGDSIDFGYNLAIAYRPNENWKIATTYRSKVNLSVKGTADLNMMGNHYNGTSKVSIPLPATLDLALAYTFKNTTFEFAYEREFWSSYKDLDFDYAQKLPVFDNPIAKNWKDSNIYKFGITHNLNNKFKIFGGFAYNENPAPVETVGFELPDSDSFIYSGGFEYKINDDLSFALGYLYCDKKSLDIDRKTDNPITTLQGNISDASAHILSTSFKYRF